MEIMKPLEDLVRSDYISAYVIITLYFYLDD